MPNAIRLHSEPKKLLCFTLRGESPWRLFKHENIPLPTQIKLFIHNKIHHETKLYFIVQKLSISMKINQKNSTKTEAENALEEMGKKYEPLKILEGSRITGICSLKWQTWLNRKISGIPPWKYWSWTKENEKMRIKFYRTDVRWGGPSKTQCKDAVWRVIGIYVFVKRRRKRREFKKRIWNGSGKMYWMKVRLR